MATNLYPVEDKPAGEPAYLENADGNKKHTGRIDSPTSDSDVDDPELASLNEKAVVRKIDYHLVPWLSLLYLLSFLDRTNIGNANLFGLTPDLGLTTVQYNSCLAIFFAFYVIFEVPSNMVMKAWRPSMWLPIIMIAWGAT